MIKQGGIYVLELLTNYAVTGWCRFFLSFWEFFAIGWIYGTANMCDLIEDMVDYKLGIVRHLFHYAWRYIGPGICLVTQETARTRTFVECNVVAF